MSEEGRFWLKFIGAGVIALGVLVGVIAICTTHDQRQCTEQCVEARFRPTQKACAFYCAWGRPHSSSDVVVMPVPMVQP